MPKANVRKRLASGSSRGFSCLKIFYKKFECFTASKIAGFVLNRCRCCRFGLELRPEKSAASVRFLHVFAFSMATVAPYALVAGFSRLAIAPRRVLGVEDLILREELAGVLRQGG